MPATLEQIDIFQTAFVVIDGDDYLDARDPDWIVFEKIGAVLARDRKVYVAPDCTEVLADVAAAFPAKYAPDGRRI